MKYNLLFLYALMATGVCAQSPVINEFDSDTDGVDTKEFVEIKTSTPFESLDGYLLVLFNGSSNGGDASYYNLDLDGFTTDINGLFVLGGSEVSPVVDFTLPNNSFQNGADAIAIYQADESDMPIGSVATTQNLIDALVYDTNDADDIALLSLLGLTTQINEGENGNKDFESIQRANDGTWYVSSPTPKQLNDGSGVILNGISINVSQEVYDEGDVVDIILTSDDPISNDTVFDLSLENGNFDGLDYTGSTQITMLSGTNSAQTSITILNDGTPEEDEFMNISFQNLPTEFIQNNTNVEIVVIDADFITSNFGTPINPTFGSVSSNAPSSYYDSIDGLSGDQLLQGIQDIIADESTVRTHPYADIIEILSLADQNPENNNQVWLMYTEQPRAKYLFQTGSSGTGKWNREHTFPRSRGNYGSIQDDDIPTGINSWWNTNADSLRHANSDAHGLRAVDALENSQRGNKHYGDYEGPDGNLGSFKGDVARAIFFLSLRYNGLDVVDGFPDSTGQLGDLATLLAWHQQDPPDDYEMNRNNVIFDWQKNRNPFIDFPNLVDFVWGSDFGNPWNQNLSQERFDHIELSLYPNPTRSKTVFIKGLPSQNKYKLSLTDASGKLILEKELSNDLSVYLNVESGLYFIKIEHEKERWVKKLIVD